MSAIDVFMVHWTVQTAQFISSPRGWHARASEKTMTQHHGFINQPFGAREVTLAQFRVVNTPAMSENHPLTGRCVENVDVVKFVLLNVLHVLLVFRLPLAPFLHNSNRLVDCHFRKRNFTANAYVHG